MLREEGWAEGQLHIWNLVQDPWHTLGFVTVTFLNVRLTSPTDCGLQFLAKFSMPGTDVKQSLRICVTWHIPGFPDC